MANTTYIGMSAALAADHRLDVVSNNLANANTVGFRQQRTVFEQFLVNTNDGSPAQKGFTSVIDTAVDTHAGELEHTNNPMDVAIQGEGYFVVRGPQGLLTTRAGALQLDPAGNLTDASGFPVLGGTVEQGLNPIQVSPGGRDLQIAADGSVMQDGAAVARIAIVNIDPTQPLEPIGNAHFQVAPNGLQTVQNPTLAVGYLESSNVDLIRGMVELIEVTHDSESAHKLMNEARKLDRAILQSAR